MRAISRQADVSINTVSELLVDAGLACARFHDENVRGVTARIVQCDEIWSFCYAKAKNLATAKGAPAHAATCGLGIPISLLTAGTKTLAGRRVDVNQTQVDKQRPNMRKFVQTIE